MGTLIATLNFNSAPVATARNAITQSYVRLSWGNYHADRHGHTEAVSDTKKHQVNDERGVISPLQAVCYDKEEKNTNTKSKGRFASCSTSLEDPIDVLGIVVNKRPMLKDTPVYFPRRRLP